MSVFLSKANSPTQRRVGLLLVMISAISFGLMAIFVRLAYAAGVDNITLLFLRFTIAGLLMLALMLARRVALPRGRELLVLILMGALGYVGQSFAYFTALTLIPATLVALLLYLYPAIVTLLSATLLRERIGALQIGALLLALVGALLTIGRFDLVEAGIPLLGILLAASGALIYSIYILVGSRVVPHVGPIASSTTVIISAALVYSLIVAVRGLQLPTSATGWMAVLAVALVSTVVAIVTFFAGLERVGPSNASTISTFEPLITVVAAGLILGERIGPLQILGGGLILLAGLLLTRAQR